MLILTANLTILYSFLILGALGAVFGVILAISSKIFYVKTDTRIEDVKKLLPNYNCGACGFAGCSGFAEAIVKGEANDLTKCKPGKPDLNYKQIKEYLESHPDDEGNVINVKY